VGGPGPYTPWTPEDVTPVLEAYEGLTRAQVRFMRSLAVQKPGLIIHRHAVHGAPHVWPEIRPEGLVRTGPPTMHWHGAGEPPELPPGYSVLPRGSEAWREHCRCVNDNDLEEDDEHEDNHELHRHENLAKYCFPSSAWEVKPWPHDHTDSYYEDPAHLERHLARWHQEPVETRADGKHVHYRKVKSKESLARRLDVHPMAAPLFADAKLVYFGIEAA
jgi:hypothetical protein